MRLTEEAWRLLRLLAAQSGLTMTAMLEVIIRDYAQRKSHEMRLEHPPEPNTGESHA